MQPEQSTPDAPSQQPQTDQITTQPQQEQFVTPSEQPQPAQPNQDPGKVFNIIGLICAFVFLQIVGLVLSIIGYRKSKKAGFPTKLATIGIILNSVFMFIAVGILAAITFIAYDGIQERTLDAQSEIDAKSKNLQEMREQLEE